MKKNNLELIGIILLIIFTLVNILVLCMVYKDYSELLKNSEFTQLEIQENLVN